MHFSHSPEIWHGFPDLAAGVLHAAGITPHTEVESRVAHYSAIASSRLRGHSEGELPEIQAWRRAFSSLGLKPTQYRCASEALLRRFRKEGALPRIHPLVDLCNSVSLAFAVPVAVFDLANVDGFLQVRHAAGSETYLAFSGETEHPEPGEVIFADAANEAHARRWTNRQSARSAVRNETASVLVVAEALHAGAAADVRELVAALEGELATLWGVTAEAGVPDREASTFEFG